MVNKNDYVKYLYSMPMKIFLLKNMTLSEQQLALQNVTTRNLAQWESPLHPFIIDFFKKFSFFETFISIKALLNFTNCCTSISVLIKT